MSEKRVFEYVQGNRKFVCEFGELAKSRGAKKWFTLLAQEQVQ